MPKETLTGNSRYDPPYCLDIDKRGGVWDYNIRTWKPHNPAGSVGIHIGSINPGLKDAESVASFVVKACNSHGAQARTIEAIRARIQGEWDNPALKAFGALSTDTKWDILKIIEWAGK